jgi:nucleotide-binding universal stress UspA family protein
MKKRILLPTDFSKNAWNALTYALELYKNEECDLYLLNAFSTKPYNIDSIVFPEPGEESYDIAEKHAQKGLEKIIKLVELYQTNPIHKFFIMTFFGSPVDAIKETIESKDIDLVVMGNKGETDAESIIYGSNAVQSMEESRNCPVLMIPKGVTYSEPKEIVFPTNYKNNFKRMELRYLYEISKITNAKVRILYVAKEEELSETQIENKNMLEDCFDGLNYSFHWLDNADVINGLHNFVQSRRSDMVAIISEKHSFFEKIFTRSIVEDLGYNSQVPVLVMHDLTN